MNIDWEPLRQIIDGHQRFVLTSHKNPDADALGSELAMAGFLDGLGKSVRIINPSASPTNLQFLDPDGRIKKLGDGVTVEEALDTDVHVVLDTGAWQQLLKMADVVRNSSAAKVVIDHHVSSDDLGATEFKDVRAEATGAMLYRMAESLGFPVTEQIAVPLYCAIATDTGWFRFPSTTRDTMRIAGELIDAGAQPSVIYELLYERFSPGRLRLAGVALDRVATAADGRLAYTWVQQADIKRTGARPADTENLVNECLKIEGTQCAFIAIEQPNKQIKVSFRSRPGLDVAAIAETFGGGGHKQASGATLPGPMDDAREKVLAALYAALNE
ncbi:MAG: bifunctional oligoribonuclease/PAP phosphatase NrnA [Planctomycetaceae bacterium]